MHASLGSNVKATSEMNCCSAWRNLYLMMQNNRLKRC